jgi:hypothetical protein
MASFWKEIQLGMDGKKKASRRAHDLENQSVRQGPRSLISLFWLFSTILFYSCSNFVRMKDMLWIEDIVESASILPILINFKVDMIDFVIFTRWLLQGMHFQLFQVHEI